MSTVSKQWTTDADFDAGTLVNVNHTAVANQLQLDAGPAAGTFRYLVVPVTNPNNPGLGLVRVNADTGEIIGAYRTAPEGFATAPKALAVDSLGNVWVGNSAEASVSGGTAKGSVCKIGMLLGGTRCDEDGTENNVGLFRKAPFLYSTAVDRGTAAVYRSSFGLTDVLGWVNATDGAGGATALVEDATDECILLYQRTAPITVSMVCVLPPSDDVWIGGYTNGSPIQPMQKLDDATGAVLDTLTGGTFSQFQSGAGTVLAGGYAGYAAHVGVAPYLWTTDPVNPAGFGCFVQINLSTRTSFPLVVSTNSFWSAATEGPAGLLYICSGTSTAQRLDKYNAEGTHQGPGWPFILTGSQNRTLAVCPALGKAWDGHVFVASYGLNTVQHVNPTNPPASVGSVNVGAGLGGVLGLGPDGLCVDSNGKVWVACTSSGSLVRIDPALAAGVGAVDMAVSLGNGAGPIAIGTMWAGSVATASVQPSGTWTVLYTGSGPYLAWTTISWHETVPANTTLTVEWRTAATLELLALTAWVLAGTHTGPVTANTARAVGMSGLIGKYVEVRVSFDRPTTEAATPDLRDLTITGNDFADLSHPARDPFEPIPLDPVFSDRAGIARRAEAETGQAAMAGAVAGWATIPQSERG